MGVHRHWTLATIGVLCSLILSACVGSTSEQASSTGATAATLKGKRTSWGPVSLILPKGFALIKTSGTLDTADGYAATDDPETHRTLLAVSILDVGKIKATFNAKTQAESMVKTAQIIATRGAVSLKQTPLAGTDDAWTMEYDAVLPLDPSQQTHLRHIFADVGDRVVLLIGQAPASGFPGSDVAAALASVRIEG